MCLVSVFCKFIRSDIIERHYNYAYSSAAYYFLSFPMLLAMIVLQFLSVIRVSVCRCSPDCAGIMVRNAVVLNGIDT